MSPQASVWFVYAVVSAWWSFFKHIFDFPLFAVCSLCNLLFNVAIRIPVQKNSSKRGWNEIGFQTRRGYCYHFLPKMKPKIQKPQALYRPPYLCVFETERKCYRWQRLIQCSHWVTGWNHGFNFRHPFVFTFYKTFRPAVSLIEPSVELVWNGGVLFCPWVKSHPSRWPLTFV